MLFCWARRYTAVLILVLGGFLVYGQTAFYPFVHDDLVFIKYNPHIRDLSHLPELFFQKDYLQTGLPLANVYYRPLLAVFQRVQYVFFGDNPAGYHLCNVSLHVASAVVLFSVLKFIFPSDKARSSDKSARANIAGVQELFSAPFLVSALFLFHPAQSEAVACVSGVSNLLFAFLCLLSLWAGVRAAGSSRAMALKWSAWFLYLVALFVKEQAVILPFLFLALVIYRRKELPRNSVPSRFGETLLGFVILTAGYFLWRRAVLGAALPTLVFSGEFWLRVKALPHILGAYLGVLLFPHDLHYYRSVDILGPAGGWFGALVLLSLGGAGLISRMSHSKRRIVVLGLAWFTVTLAPTIGILPLVHEYSFIASFEHFLYLPLVGFALVLVGVWESCEEKNRHLSGKRGIWWGSVFLLLAVLTVRQNMFWRGEVPLFERVVEQEPQLGRARMLLARAYYFEQRHQEAQAQFEKALGIMKSYEVKAVNPASKEIYRGFIKEIYFELAHSFEATGNWAGARDAYQAGLALCPSDSVVLNNLGVVFLRLNDFVQAERTFRHAVALNPREAMAMSNLAYFLIQRGNRAEGERLLQQAVAIDRNLATARKNLQAVQAGK